MAQPLRALTLLQQDMGLNPSTPIAAHNYLQLHFHWMQDPHTGISAGKTPVHM